MKFATIKKQVQEVPYILPDLAVDLYDFVLGERPQNSLELGFAHGASSCYIAAALDEIGCGHLDSVDLIPARGWQNPSIESLLAATGLQDRVTVTREATSYTWFLKKKIERHSTGDICTPIYDFCFIDGSKNWTIDGAAFFLVDKLLKPGGWILFDDLQWTYRSKRQEGKTKTDGVSVFEMGGDELDEPHVELIFKLLVMQHPDYSHFTVKDNWWAWARKAPGPRDVSFILSDAYRTRLAAWERDNNTTHRQPFRPFSQH